MAFAAGDKLGSYAVLGLIGAGGMGELYRARDTKLKRDVALKVLPEVVRERFRPRAHVQADRACDGGDDLSLSTRASGRSWDRRETRVGRANTPLAAPRLPVSLRHLRSSLGPSA
ncbi:MAG: serine/threonine protein kinase [Bryobacterales bacterium]|nr:serine/threonine protein kinase [Bryobacterales bacterium]